jgi:hypothetical protein
LMEGRSGEGEFTDAVERPRPVFSKTILTPDRRHYGHAA